MISRLHLDPRQGVLPVPVALPPHVSGAAPPVVPAHCQLLQLQLDLEVVQLHLGSQVSQIHATKQDEVRWRICPCAPCEIDFMLHVFVYLCVNLYQMSSLVFTPFIQGVDIV